MNTIKNSIKTTARNGFVAVKRKKIYEEIIAQIQEQVRNGLLKPGDRLPPERRLAEIFKVSRHSIREALRTLEQSHMLKSIRGSGTYLTLGDKESIVDLLAASLLKDTDKLNEIFQFRKIVEPQVARMAAENASVEDIVELEELVKRQKKAYKDGKLDVDFFIRLDKEFHLNLARATGNEVILRVVDRINDILSQSREEVYQSESRVQSSIKGHAAVIRAIKKRDSAGADNSMFRHLASIEKIVLKKVFSQQ